jgi:hypothetical protein
MAVPAFGAVVSLAHLVGGIVSREPDIPGRVIRRHDLKALSIAQFVPVPQLGFD